MKNLIMFLILGLNSIGFAQGEIGQILYEKEPKAIFPSGFNPDGRIGSSVLTLFVGLITESYKFSGKKFYSNTPAFAGQLAFPLDRNSTLFAQVNYANDLDEFIKRKIWYLGIGIKLFGGMGNK